MSETATNLPIEVTSGISAVSGSMEGFPKAKLVLQYMLWDVENGKPYKELDDVLVENCIYRMAKYDQFFRLDIVAESGKSTELNNLFKMLEDYAFGRNIPQEEHENVKNNVYLPYISGLLRNNIADEKGNLYTFAFSLPITWQLQPMSFFDNEIRCLQLTFFAENVDMVVENN